MVVWKHGGLEGLGGLDLVSGKGHNIHHSLLDRRKCNAFPLHRVLFVLGVTGFDLFGVWHDLWRIETDSLSILLVEEASR